MASRSLEICFRKGEVLHYLPQSTSGDVSRMARDHGVQPLFGMPPDFVAAFSLPTELATEVAQSAC